MFGLGKNRSKYGKFLDKHGVDQREVCKISGLNKDTLTKACTDDNATLRLITKKALADAARKISRKDVDIEDFWDC